VKEKHGLHHSTVEIAMSPHEVSILIVYQCGQTVPGSHQSREVLLTFAGSPVPFGKSKRAKGIVGQSITKGKTKY
jgi:hypothetical protein